MRSRVIGLGLPFIPHGKVRMGRSIWGRFGPHVTCTSIHRSIYSICPYIYIYLSKSIYSAWGNLRARKGSREPLEVVDASSYSKVGNCYRVMYWARYRPRVFRWSNLSLNTRSHEDTKKNPLQKTASKKTCVPTTRPSQSARFCQTQHVGFSYLNSST